MSVAFRQAMAGDAALVVRMHEAAMRDVFEPTRDRDVRDLSPGLSSCAFDAENSAILLIGDVEIGWVQLLRSNLHIVISQFLIEPEHQNQGHGKQALSLLLDAWRRADVSASVNVLKRSRARNFFVQHGFRQAGAGVGHDIMVWSAVPAPTPPNQ